MSQLRKANLLSALYIAQGLPHGFFTQALPTILRSQGVSLPVIGLAHLLVLPWALKFLWAPAVDLYQYRPLGHRRSWLLPLQITSTLLYLILGMFAVDSSLAPVMVGFLLMNFVAATQDIATDGLAVDMLPPKERGWANGIQVAAYRIGMIISGVVLLRYFDQLHWSGIMFALAGLNILCTIPVLLYREPLTSQSKRSVGFKDVASSIFHLLKRGEGAPFWFCVLLIFKFAHASASALMRPWLVDQGYKVSEIAGVMGMGGFVAGLFGAIGGGWLASKYDRKRSLVYLGALQSIAVASYLWPVFSEHSTTKILIAVALDHFTSGLATTILFTLMMDACSKERAASDYTIQASAVVVSQSLAPVLGGFVADEFGYETNFVLCSIIAFLGVGFTAWVFRNKTRTLFASQTMAILAFLFVLSPSTGYAQQGGEPSKARTEFGLHTGPFLPRKIAYVREILAGWGPRLSLPTRKGVFEIEGYIARSDGISYNTLSLDYRIDIPNDALPAHFLLGGHADYYTPAEQSTRYVGGWHFGGGVKQDLGSTLALRTDFKYRFGPGTSLYVGVGLSFFLPESGGAE